MAEITDYTNGRTKDEAYRLLYRSFVDANNLDEDSLWPAKEAADFRSLVALLVRQYQ